MNKSNCFTKRPVMHYEVNFRTLLFSFAYVSCIIIVSCNTEYPKTDDEKHNFSADKPNLLFNTSNANVASHEHFSSSETSTAVKPVFSEGGPTVSIKSEKINDTTTSRSSVQNDSLQGKISELEYLPYGSHELNSSVKKPHKGRKGVEEQINSEETTSSVLKATEVKKKAEESLNNVSSRITSINSTVNSEADSLNPLVNTQVMKQELAEHLNKTSNDNAGSADLKNRNNVNVTTGSKSSLPEVVLPPRPKPEITRDDHDIDHSSYSLTSTETDYVIPIVATIFAAPLLIVLGMFLYKRSKEFWERRHYRRMDFLIDGMYND